jgi:predicted metal-dependent HD superfamily phosphohydrolase
LNSRTEPPDWLGAVWNRALTEAGATAPEAEIARLGTKLLDRWCNPARVFHGIGHLIMVLEKIDELSQEASCPCLVRLAAFYHGAALSPGPAQLGGRAWSEDEAASAELAYSQLTHLGLPETKAARVRALVLSLGGRSPDLRDPDAAVLGDAERAVLAADPRAYRAYAEGLRAECEGGAPIAVLEARIGVLRSWLSRGRLFSTSSTAAWEETARNNIEAELVRALKELAAAEALDPAPEHDFAAKPGE